jgi:hypothetical protein
MFKFPESLIGMCVMIAGNSSSEMIIATKETEDLAYDTATGSTKSTKSRIP